MADEIVTGARDTNNLNSGRLKRDMAGGPKAKILSIHIPVSSRSKKKKSKKEKYEIE